MPDAGPDADEFVPMKQLSAELGVARSTFYRWTKTGKGPKAYKFGTQSLRFRRSDVEAWIASNKLDEAQS